MQTLDWTVASLQTHFADLKRRLREFLPLKHSKLVEAHARGFGYNTDAALKAALKASPVLAETHFDTQAFALRVEELEGVQAEIVEEIVNGVELDINIVKRSEQRQRADRFVDVAYDVSLTVRLSDKLAHALRGEAVFTLPEFGRGAGQEPYRVDSAHDHRVVSGPRQTRSGQGESTLRAKLVDGQWRGGFYVYATEHQEDDVRCKRSLRTALTRAVLAQLPTGVRCFIFRPDSYSYGTWRIEIRLPHDVWKIWNDVPFHFELPTLPHRNVGMEKKFCVGPTTGRFIDGVWEADIETKDIDEAKNPTTLLHVKRALVDVVRTQAYRAGYLEEGRVMPVLGVDGHFIGTVSASKGRFLAWRRERRISGSGKRHSHLGNFDNLEQAITAIRR